METLDDEITPAAIKYMGRFYTTMHQNILDVFNEHGVQIMAPAYEGDPETPKVLPKERSPARPVLISLSRLDATVTSHAIRALIEFFGACSLV